MERAELQELVADYQPNPGVVQQLNQLTLVITLGPSAVGKTTVMRASGLPMVLGDASRQPRPSEENGVDYWFRSEADMVRDVQSGQYVQIAVGAGGDLKGTRASSFPERGVATFAVVASAIKTFRALPFAATKTAVIVPPSFEEWMRRMGVQQSSASQMESRLAEAYRSLSFALEDNEACFILNDDLATAARCLRQLAVGELPVTHEQAREVAVQLLKHVKVPQNGQPLV